MLDLSTNLPLEDRPTKSEATSPWTVEKSWLGTEAFPLFFHLLDTHFLSAWSSSGCWCSWFCGRRGCGFLLRSRRRGCGLCFLFRGGSGGFRSVPGGGLSHRCRPLFLRHWGLRLCHRSVMLP